MGPDPGKEKRLAERATPSELSDVPRPHSETTPEEVAVAPNWGDDAIRFYRTGDLYGAFSNFSAHPIDQDGLRFATSEHYYQYYKFTQTRPDLAQQILADPNPMSIATLARVNKEQRRADWNDVKDDVMRLAVMNKIIQHPEVRRLLLQTGDKSIVEDTTQDSYWGDAMDGQGKNMLGRILMEVREQVRTHYEYGGDDAALESSQYIGAYLNSARSRIHSS